MALDLKKMMQKPHIAVDDMADNSAEAVEIVTSCVDKFIATENYEVRHPSARAAPQPDARSARPSCARRPRPVRARALSPPPSPPPRPGRAQKAAQAVKEALDKKFGPTWHVCVGEGFGYDVTYNSRNMILVYYGEKIGILCFKC